MLNIKREKISQSIAILCKDNYSAKFIVNSLAIKYNIVRVIFEKESYSRTFIRVVKRISKDGIMPIIERLLFLICYVLFFKKGINKDFQTILKRYKSFDNYQLLEEIKDKIFYTKEINENNVQKSVLKWHPDLILIFGTSMLNDNWLNLSIPIINVHYGLSQYHRGRFCSFWALYENKPDKIGITIHFLKKKVDSGQAILQKKLPEDYIAQIDSLGKLWAFQAIIALDAIIESVQIIMDKKPTDNKMQNMANGKLYFEPEISKYLRWLKK